MFSNDLAISPLVVWKNPAGKGAMIQLGGSVSWSGGGGTNTSSVDYMLALHRLTDNSWQTLDSVSGLFAVTQGAAGIALSWTQPAVPPSGYILQRSANGEVFQTLASIAGSSVSYLDTTVLPGIAYSYQLVSSNAVVSATTPSVTATFVSGSNTFPPGAFANIADYGMMWWRSGVRGEHVWQVRTSRYAMTFYGDTLNLTTLFPIPAYIPETQALVQPISQSIPDSAPVCSSAFTLTAAGTTSAIAASDTSTSSQQLLENGKFYQRRWQKIKTTSRIVLDSTNSGLEVCAWPDRVSVVCRVIPTTDVASGSLDMTLSLQSIYNILSGWGTHQQWDEAAIGCWGESLCYEPDSTQAAAIGTDSRPMLLLSSSSAQKGWTGNLSPPPTAPALTLSRRPASPRFRPVITWRLKLNASISANPPQPIMGATPT